MTVITDDFEQFWSIYPRRVHKAAARKMWTRLTAEEKFAAAQALPIHVRYWKAAGRSVECIPHAASWLNPEDGRRWEDELEMPETKVGADWMRSKEGIEAKAREVGCWPARANEDWHSLKARILSKTAA